MKELTLEEELIQSLRPFGIELAARTFGIDVQSGNTRCLESRRPKRLKNFWFDQMWVEKNHHLVIRLVNVRTRDGDQEWRDLLEFFHAAHYAPIGMPKWNPNEPIEAVRTKWRKYRDLTRELIETPWFGWSRLSEKKYGTELIRRATRSPVEKFERKELYDPLDALWIALFWSRIKGMNYVHCKNPDCERYVPISWRGQGRGRPQLYCDKKCEDRWRKKRERSNAKKKNRSRAK